jgi:hypothetical protein
MGSMLVVIVHVTRIRIPDIVALELMVVQGLASLMNTQISSRKHAIEPTPIRVIINLQFIIVQGQRVTI